MQTYQPPTHFITFAKLGLAIDLGGSAPLHGGLIIAS